MSVKHLKYIPPLGVFTILILRYLIIAVFQQAHLLVVIATGQTHYFLWFLQLPSSGVAIPNWVRTAAEISTLYCEFTFLVQTTAVNMSGLEYTTYYTHVRVICRGGSRIY